MASQTADHAPFTSPQTGWAEQQPADWWRATCEAVKQVLAASDTKPSEIAAVGFSGQMHGAVLLDAAGEVLRPALIWCDQRTADEARELTEQIGADQIIAWTCNPALTNFTLTKLLWVRKHEPNLFERFRTLLLPKDYVRFRLTGDYGMDMADASGTLLLDVANRRWSTEMARATGLDPACLPPLFESPDVCATISKAGAAATGLLEGTPVVAGAGDQAAGAVGLGIVSPGAVHATIGTSGVVFASTDRPALDPHGRLHTFCHAIPNRWHVMGVTQSAGLSLRWFRDNFGAREEDARDPYERLVGRSRFHSSRLRWRALGAVPDGRAHSTPRSQRACRPDRSGSQPRPRPCYSRHFGGRCLQPCAIHSRSLRKCMFLLLRFVSAAEARVRHCGARFRPTFTVTRLRSCRRKKARHTERPCWPELVPEPGRASTKRVSDVFASRNRSNLIQLRPPL